MARYICGNGHSHEYGTIARGQTVACVEPGCGVLINHLKRVNNDRGLDDLSFAHGGKKQKTNHIPVLPGRSQAAPPAPNLTSWPRPVMPANHTYVASLKASAWKNAGQGDVRLAYESLDLNTSGMQGLIVSGVNANRDAEVRRHFDACTALMLKPGKAQDVTEATGEAAAALWVLRSNTFATYEMVWGFHKHAGAGIDQIWKDKNSDDYLIVEAKGPSASLKTSTFYPPGYNQMELNWVIDRLGRMSNGGASGAQLADDILAALNVDLTVAHQNYNNSSKSYYGYKKKPGARRGSITGRTVTARWLSSGAFSASATTHAWTL